MVERCKERQQDYDIGGRWCLNIPPKMKTVCLLTTYKLLLNNGLMFGVVSPGFDDGRHSLWYGLIEGIEVLRGQSVSRPSFQIFTISDLNKPTL